MSLKTGFENLDSIIGGLNEKDLIVIASRPGMSKSSLAINIINNVSKQTKDNILYFNLEASKNNLKRRIIGNNVEIVDTPRLSIEKIKSRCEEVSKVGLSLVVIDYIQLISTSCKLENTHNTSEHIIRTLKILSTELNVPIIILYQLGRTLEERKDKRPKLSDFRVNLVREETDKVIFLYKEYELNNVELIVAKNSNGSTGKVDLVFDSDTLAYK